MSNAWTIKKNAYGEVAVLLDHPCLANMPGGTKIKYYDRNNNTAVGRLMADGRGVLFGAEAVETFNVPQPVKGKTFPTFSFYKWEIVKTGRNTRR